MASSIHAVVASALCLAAGSASAGEPAPWGAYVATDIGATYFHVSKGRLDNWTASSSGSSSLDKGDHDFSLAAGFRFSPNWAAEVAFLDLGRSSYVVQDAAGDTAFGLGSQGAVVSVIGALPINRTLSLEGRAGLYFGQSKMHGWVSAEFEIPKGKLVALEGAGGGNPGFLLGAGVVASFGAHWAARLGYDYIGGNALTVSSRALGDDMESSAGRVSLGLRYLF